MSQPQVAEMFIAAADEILTEGFRKIEHCVLQLNDQQIWWRPQPHSAGANPFVPGSEMNSIANLMLHLSGNVRQWIIAGVGGANDVRNRPLEFSDHSQRPKAEVLAQLKATVVEALAVLSHLNADQLTAARRIQGFDTTVLEAVFSTIAHFRGHTQEIIHMTREQLGNRYRFDFVPQGAEQESAGGVK